MKNVNINKWISCDIAQLGALVKSGSLDIVCGLHVVNVSNELWRILRTHPERRKYNDYPDDCERLYVDDDGLLCDIYLDRGNRGDPACDWGRSEHHYMRTQQAPPEGEA